MNFSHMHKRIELIEATQLMNRRIELRIAPVYHHQQAHDKGKQA